MKFLCERCKTKYSIGDERVRGKILKIRCRNCANIITVREEPPASALLSEELSRMGEGKSPPSALDKALGKALGAGGVAAAPTASEALSASKPASKLETWYVAVGQDQRGPMSLDKIVEQLGRMIKPAEALVWRDGLEDWVRADAVAELKDRIPRAPMSKSPGSGAVSSSALKGDSGAVSSRLGAEPSSKSTSRPAGSQSKMPPPPAAAGAGGGSAVSELGDASQSRPGSRSSATSIPLSQLMASGAAPLPSLSKSPSAPMPSTSDAVPTAANGNLSSGAHGSGGHGSGGHGSQPPGTASDAALEFAIDEPSRIVRLDALVPLTGKIATGTPASSGKVFAMPGPGADDNEKDKKPGIGGMGTKGPGTGPLGTLMATPSISGSDVSSIPPGYAPATPEKREVHHYRMLSVVLGTMVLGLAVAVLWLWPRMTPQKIIVERDKSPEDIGAEIAELLVKEAASNRVDPAMLPPQGADSIPTKSRRSSGRSASASSGKSAQGRSGDRLGDLYADSSKSGPDIKNLDRPQEDAVGMFKRGAKLCYERALKRDPSMAQMTKVEVSITTASSGDVSNIQISDPYRSQFLGQCLSFMIKKLPWPTEGRVWQFPLVFRGS